MAASPTVADIMQAVNDSGFLMEQTVASQLEQRGYHVETNYAYEDPEEGKSREMDVRAVDRIAINEEKKVAAFIEIIVECKNSDNPFVFIGRQKNIKGKGFAPQELRFPKPMFHASRLVPGKKHVSQRGPSGKEA
jgi:hypothetical protein